MVTNKSLTNLQLELLQLFQYELEDTQLEDIRAMLVAYFAQKVTDEMDILFEENGWGEEKIDEWADSHMRTSH